MGANLSQEQKDNLFEDIINDMSINGLSLRKALIGRMFNDTFYAIINGDKKRMEQYACACESRADYMFDEILEIADDTSADKKTIEVGSGVEIEKVDNEAIQRSKLRVDARKWQLSKMQPKKYGDKLDLTTDGDKINHESTIKLNIDGKEVKLK